MLTEKFAHLNSHFDPELNCVIGTVFSVSDLGYTLKVGILQL